MLLAIKTQLKLNKNQKLLMAKHAGIPPNPPLNKGGRGDWGLAVWKDLYDAGCKPNKYLLKKFFNNHVKPEYPWIKEKGICQKITQFAFDQLGDAFTRFFKGLGDYPRFKKKGRHDSFTIDAGGKPIHVGGTSIKLPTIGWVKTYEGLPHTTTQRITISRIADDWYIAFSYEQFLQISEKKQDVVGVDLGINALATVSSGKVFPNPKQYRKSLNKLKKLSRQYAKTEKGSNRRYKAKIKLARHHARVSNIRKDALHKITNYLCKNHAMIVIEDLNVSGLLKNHHLAQSIADCGFSEFRRQLEYKCQKFGSELVIADRFYPSSQICSHCGYRQKMPLKERIYCCPNCHQVIDRDLNAAINLSRLAKA